jgi:hypothetical protein
MTDNGLAALAERLHPHTCFDHPDGAHIPPLCATRAAAILGERGVFLPDGLTGEDLRRSDFVDEQAATIATLRAALDGLVAWESHLRRQHLDGTHLNDGICPGFDHCATARVLAAMIDATAKEAGG